MWGKTLKIGVPLLVLFVLLGLMAFASNGLSLPLIDTKGFIADQQRDLLFLTVSLMLIIIIPIFILLFAFAVRYKETNTHSKYKPNWDSNRLMEIIWWGIPIVIISILAVVTWNTSHSLDPYRAFDTSREPLKVQVIALQWKWLFIYPEQKVASINQVTFPVNRQVAFSISSDAPMNSFWIPQLGGQVYAMSGMVTKLHLNANEVGDYRGVAANISGEGHSGMTFTARAISGEDFSSWVNKVGNDQETKPLDMNAYDKLRQPSTSAPVEYFTLEEDVFDQVVAKYSHNGMEGMDHAR